MRQSDRVYRDLRSLLIEFAYPPGAALSEGELSNRLNASRTPIRESLQRLSREGLVKLVPGRGAFVAEISVPDVAELFQMREALEPYAARLAAAQPDLPVIDSLLDQLDKADVLLQDDVPGYYQLTARIDQAIVTMAGNSRLKRTLDEIWVQVRRARRSAATNPDRLRESVHEHHAILQAIAASDPARSEEAAREHVRCSMAHFLNASVRGIAPRPHSRLK